MSIGLVKMWWFIIMWLELLFVSIRSLFLFCRTLQNFEILYFYFQNTLYIWTYVSIRHVIVWLTGILRLFYQLKIVHLRLTEYTIKICLILTFKEILDLQFHWQFLGSINHDEIVFRYGRVPSASSWENYKWSKCVHLLLNLIFDLVFFLIMYRSERKSLFVLSQKMPYVSQF